MLPGLLSRLPTPCTRILVLGGSCAGKTTLARALSRETGLPHHELDLLYWVQPGVETHRAKFRSRVAELAANPRWILEGHDSKVRDLTWPRAQAAIWLDPPPHRVLFRAMRRPRPASAVFWALRTHFARRREYSALLAEARFVAIRTD